MIVIRNEGPAGGPGMREMLFQVTAAIVGEGLGEEVALLTDGRSTTASQGLVVRGRASSPRRRPRAARSRPSAKATR